METWDLKWTQGFCLTYKTLSLALSTAIKYNNGPGVLVKAINSGIQEARQVDLVQGQLGQHSKF